MTEDSELVSPGAGANGLAATPIGAPVISVVTAARNMEGFIAETLNSLVAQTFGAFESIIVDDGSSDRTPEIVREFAARDPRFRMIAGPCRGVSAARNAGLAEARADRVLFLDADDNLTPGALERMSAELDAHPDHVAVAARSRRIHEDGSDLDPPEPQGVAPTGETLNELLKRNWVGNGGVLLLRTDAVRQAGGYDETLAFAEDWEMWCRIALIGPFAPVNDLLAMDYRIRGAGANYRARQGVFARKIDALDRVATNPHINERLGARQVRQQLRQFRIDTFWSGVLSELHLGDRGKAFLIALGGAALYPDSVLRPRLAMRFLRKLTR